MFVTQLRFAKLSNYGSRDGQHCHTDKQLELWAAVSTLNAEL
jgi:hypothetical protein